jgi:yeast amino acid transporter
VAHHDSLDLNIPIFIALYLGWKFLKKTKVWKPEEMDFVRGIPSVEETELPYVPPTTLRGKIFDALF